MDERLIASKVFAEARPRENVSGPIVKVPTSLNEANCAALIASPAGSAILDSLPRAEFASAENLLGERYTCLNLCLQCLRRCGRDRLDILDLSLC